MDRRLKTLSFFQFICIIIVSALFAGSAAATVYSPEPPHSDYRVGYLGSCGGGTACHSINKSTFLPESLDTTASRDYTNFCLGCHNAAGEAHDKSAGSASTNSYINLTGLDLTQSYSGASHSWNGRNGNASTRTPLATDFDGTLHMPGGNVRCQTCHLAMNKSSVEQNIDWESTNNAGGYTRYRFVHYTSTAKYLSQYIKVYRSTGSMTRPQLSRTKKQYLVAPSEYTYNNRSAMITFKSPQDQFTYIYADIPEPYLRVANPGNAICVDCHSNRNSVSVPHDPGAGVKAMHPVGVNYGRAFGSHTTLRNITAVKLYLEGNRVLCTTCHDPHNSASNNGQLLREADPSRLCMDCHDSARVAPHGGKKHPKYANSSTVQTGCADCHSSHSSNNIYLVKSRLKTPAGPVRAVNFQSFTGTRGFGSDNGDSVCEVCHTQTKYHKADGSGTGHNPRKNCTACHTHKNGFQPAGGNSPCYGCHDGSIAPDIKTLMGLGTSFAQGGKTSRHFITFDNASSSSCLAMCHTSNHDTGSPNLKTQPELTLCGSCHSTEGQTTTTGNSINVMMSFGTSLHNYTATVQDEFGMFAYNGNCTKCHLPHGSDSYPNARASINGKATNGNSEDLCFGCHDTGRSRGAVDIKTLWKANPTNHGHYDYAAGKQMNCVRCHGPHGTGNSKMIKDSLGGPGLARDAICRSCHSGSGSVYNVMGTTPGSYGPNFSAGSVHDFGLNVAIGGKTVDLTCTGCHDPHNTQNARLLQAKVVFSGISAVSVPTVTAVVSPQGPVTSYGGGWTSYCTICHTSLKDTGGQSPYRRHPTGLQPGAFYPYTAGMGLKTLPLESGNVSCITCHYTHGSPKPKLQRIQDPATPENRLCLQCHSKNKFLQGGAGSHGGFVQNQGRCADCHNMHDDANKRLLVEATESVLCERCHAGSGVSKYNVWRQLTSMDPLPFEGTGGTFGLYSGLRGGTAASMHAINDEATPAPGGVTTQHRCGTCHNPHGSKNYRILRDTVNNVTGIAVFARTDENGSFVNYSTGIVKFCTACHTSYKTTSDGNGNWIRHPVGVSLNNYTAQLNFYTNNTSYKPKVELEVNKTIACVSCHFAHGSGADANLKYPGGKTVNACKTCHNRDAFSAGTPGSHAGYTSNNGTCSDCHSMHADGNPKLLKDNAETDICVNCHDKPGTSTSPNASRFDVWKGNVFNSPTSWFGTAGSFGTYNPVSGGNAFSMHPVNSDARIAPGDGATVVHCGTCHNTHGSPNYRLLKTSLNGKSGINVTATVDASGHTVAYGSGMSGFCTACHASYINCGTAAGYTRHPVDVALTAQELANYNHAQGGKYLPLEAGNKVTCITCHFAHGSPNDKMKRLPGNQMCQTCHAKGLDVTDNYVQVMYTHGGFSGNGGDCTVCHSMHAANNRKLLVVAEETDLCYGCHAQDGSRRGSFTQAQLVWKGDRPASPADWNGTAGSFGATYDPATGGSIQSHHLINKTDSAAPGGTTTEHHCGTCHNPHGNNNYRLLRDDVNGHSGISVQADSMGRYLSGISSFCAACHTTYADAGTGVEGYNRHPVNLALTAKEMTNLSTSTLEPRAQVEGGGVMCLSCHFAHGSPSYSMLRMQSYTSSQSALCQQCHQKGYNSAGQQVRHTHGGFAGNNANCGVCHSVHAKNNKKLLMEPKEANLCENCHSGIAKFNAFKAGNPDVKIYAPSRFNVFSSVGNSFGNYSVGGGEVVSWHEVDGYHTAPGGKTLELRCGKCHNPHGEDNFVMIRNTIENVTGIRVFGHLSSTGPFNTYSSGFGKLCSACHTRLTSCGTGNPWTRHPVDFRLQSKQLHNWSTTAILPRVPLESGSQVTCITCHNSHGSRNYKLQRIGGNGMCQQCHKR
jgi:predicted CXXCH cytochrome family protein